MDYGHNLILGSFLTPTNADPAGVVALARHAEDVGIDLVTFQDHPYQPAFLDAWTLMTYVAASTERVRIAANVHNLPLRPPAVLARAAASLDLLSGGRIELGLGAGAFWDAIEAMGGPRLTPGQAVDALAEGIAVIRSLWDTSTRERLVVEGEHHRLDGAKRGPAPAHDMAIWVGALKPRMLRLVGRQADGWLPSLGYLGSLEALAAGNATIDAAALAAGRRPQDVRRLLNVGGRFGPPSQDFLQGTPEQWAEQLAVLTLEYGVSAVILASDDPGEIEVFGRDVGAAWRARVAEARAGRTTV